MSYHRLIYHLVFSTRFRERTLPAECEKKLYAYIVGIVRNASGYVHAISGMEDHVHILLDMPQTESIADYVKMIKQRSSTWLKESIDFPLWGGWSKGYAVFSCSTSNMDAVLQYIRNQKEHHKSRTFEDELKKMVLKARLEYDERQML